MPTPNRFIMIDGIAGSGKTTVINAMYETLVAHGLRCFRLQDWQKHEPPRFEDLPEADVYFTYEPTRQWIGAAIRYEMSQTEHPYSGEELAHAFALDRSIMYRRLILPALAAGKTVIQDRGVTTSLVYQPVMPDSIPVEQVAALPGNRFALEHTPGSLVITKIPVEQVAARIASRNDESKGVFGDIELMRKVDARFREPWFRELFESRRTTLYDLDTSGSLEQSRANAVELIHRLLDL